MGLLSRAVRMVRMSDLPKATQRDLATWAGRAAEAESFPVRRFRVGDVAEHWAESPEQVAEYAARQTPLPPILVRTRDGRLHIVDGNHRYNAALQRGANEFEAIDLNDLGI